MSLKTVASMFTLSVVAAFSVAACAADTSETSTDPTAQAQDEDLRLAKYSACKQDSDCVATPTPACCPTGRKSAVNKSEVSAFDADNACKSKPAACPLFLIDDTRVAQCNAAKNKCEMVAAEDAHKAGDCEKNGCDSGEYCSACFGKFACIPKGAFC